MFEEYDKDNLKHEHYVKGFATLSLSESTVDRRFVYILIFNP